MSDSFKLPGVGAAGALGQTALLQAQSAASKAEQLKGAAGKTQQMTEAEKVELERAATKFEGLLLHQMIKTMWSTVTPTEGGITNSREENLYRDMFNQALADSIAESQSIGIKDVILRELKDK